MGMKIFFTYLGVMNLTGLLSFYSDKQKARKHLYRIPERRLFLMALLGGAVGCLLGMFLFHHKTRHARFVIGMPLLSILWCVILFVLFRSAFSDSAGPLFHAFLHNFTI